MDHIKYYRRQIMEMEKAKIAIKDKIESLKADLILADKFIESFNNNLNKSEQISDSKYNGKR